MDLKFPFLLISTFVIVYVLALVSKYLKWKNKFKQLYEKVPSPPGVPIFGNTFQLLVTTDKLLHLFEKWSEQYGHRVLYRVGSFWVVSLSNPRDIEKLLTSTSETVKSVDYDQLIPWLGTGLLISNGVKWATRRKLLTPAFHFKILEKFIEVFNKRSCKFVDIIQNRHKPGEVFDIVSLVSKLSLDIICGNGVETAMGVKLNALELEEDSEYITSITRVKFLQLHRAFRPWLGPSFIWNFFSYGKEEEKLLKILHEFTNQVIKRRKQQYYKEKSANENKLEADDCSDRKRSVFLDLLLEALHEGDLKSDEDVREETDTFMFEGHDTVSSGIAFTLFFIGNHQDVQEKVSSELQEIFDDDLSRPVIMQDLAKMKYLECCIKEALRICPSVPIIARSIQQNFELDTGLFLPRDTLVAILPYLLHKNKDVFADPLCYRPERFLPENSTGRHPFGYIPFSAGPRNCIGQKYAIMEAKVVLANIFRRINVTAVEKFEDLTLKSDLILYSKSGIKLKYSVH